MNGLIVLTLRAGAATQQQNHRNQQQRHKAQSNQNYVAAPQLKAQNPVFRGEFIGLIHYRKLIEALGILQRVYVLLVVKIGYQRAKGSHRVAQIEIN